MARISILIPLYNAERYLSECLDSIVCQTHKEFDVLLVNDGSTDHSLDICMEYVKKDTRFKVRTYKNAGAGVARNACMNWAKELDNDYVVWVDADDIIKPRYLEIMHNYLEQYPNCDLVQCQFSSDYQKYLGFNETLTQIEILEGTENILMETQLCKYGIAYNLLWNKMYRKRLYEGVEVYIDNKISGKIYNDVNILWQVYIKSNNCHMISEILYYYRYVPTSIQHKKLNINKLEFIPLKVHIHDECQKLNYNHFTDLIYERMHLALANNLSNSKENYVNFKEFSKEAKRMYKMYLKNTTIEYQRIDLKILHYLMNINFGFCRLYGLLYRKVKHNVKR